MYVSMLLAIGFGPLVHMIEHQRRVPVLESATSAMVGYSRGISRGRWGADRHGHSDNPTALSQAADMWTQLPEYIDRVQRFLIGGEFLTHTITLEEAVRRAPGSPGSAVGTVASAFTWT
jgi:hypothetical protein